MLNQKHSILFNLCLSAGIVLTLSSCQPQPASREYEEVVMPSPLQSRMSVHGGDPHAFMNSNRAVQEVLDASAARPALSWETPHGWTEEKGSAMRLATFRAQDSDIDCSIISLSGRAGGLQSNVVRWMRQVHAAVPSGDRLEEFLSSQEVIKTKGGFSATVIDLTALPLAEAESPEAVSPPEEGHAPSMIAAVAELQDMTVFVKMTGTKEAVLRNRDPFMSLCRSLTLEK